MVCCVCMLYLPDVPSAALIEPQGCGNSSVIVRVSLGGNMGRQQQTGELGRAAGRYWAGTQGQHERALVSELLTHFTVPFGYKPST